MKKALLALFLIASTAAPAWASSVPLVDFRPNGTSVSGGLYDLDFDHAFGDRLAVGLNTNFLSVALRATYRLGGEPGRPCWGLALAGGPSVYPGTGFFLSPGPPSEYVPVGTQTLGSGFFQPAVVWAVPLNEAWSARGTLGPVFFSKYNVQGDYRTLENMWIPLWLNWELACKFGWGELTLGGGVLGARFNF